MLSPRSDLLESQPGIGSRRIASTAPHREELAIETAGLRKSYRGVLAVADLTLQVRRGEVFGFLGPNGAGKSTALKMLVGLVRPDGGTARVLGHPPAHAPMRARIGFLPEHFRFHEWLRAEEFLDLHARLYGIDRAARRDRIPALLERVGLAGDSRRLLSEFSKGMLQRVGLAQALLNDPDVLFLDEPTSALDPFGRILVREVIQEVRERGTTVFLNSHLLGEVEVTCDRACFIKNGRVLRTVALRGLDGLVEVELRLDRAPSAFVQVLEQRGVKVRAPAASGDGALLELTLRDEQLLPWIAEQAVASGARLYALTPRRLSLEELFVQIVGGGSSAVEAGSTAPTPAGGSVDGDA